jgi:hypothetical protein
MFTDWHSGVGLALAATPSRDEHDIRDGVPASGSPTDGMTPDKCSSVSISGSTV